MKISQAGKVLALVAGGCLYSLQAQSALVGVGSDGSGLPVGTPFGEPSGGVTTPFFTGTMYLEVFDSGGGTFSRTGDAVAATGGDYTYVFQFDLDADLGTNDGLAEIAKIDFSAFMLGTGDTGTGGLFTPGPTGGGALGGADPAFNTTGGFAQTATFTFGTTVAEGTTSAAFWFTKADLDMTATGTTAVYAIGDRLTFAALTTTASSAGADIQVVPVPAAVWLFGSGLLGLVGMAKRRRS